MHYARRGFRLRGTAVRGSPKETSHSPSRKHRMSSPLSPGSTVCLNLRSMYNNSNMCQNHVVTRTKRYSVNRAKYIRTLTLFFRGFTCISSVIPDRTVTWQGGYGEVLALFNNLVKITRFWPLSNRKYLVKITL
jgi:hypothetical protein